MREMVTYPLLQSQLGVLLQSMQHPESTQYNLPSFTFISLSVTRERVASAIRTLVRSFPELHTRFVTDEHGEIRQWCDLSMDIPVVSRKCTEEALQLYLSDGFIRPFRLFGSEPLFRAEVVETEKNICMLLDGHHAIVDGMSFLPIISTSLARHIEGCKMEIPSYGMYQAAEAEAASFGTEAYQRAKDFYAQKFGGLDMATLSRSQYGTMGRMGRRSAVVSRRHCDDWCREHGVQPNLLFQAALGHVLSVLTHQQRVAYAAVNHGRMDKRLRGSIGMFVKTVPLLANADPSLRVVDFVKSQRGELMSSIRYGIYPFTHFCSDLGMKPGVTFNFLAVADMVEHMMLSEGEMRTVQPVRKEIDSDLSVDIYLNGDSYEIRVQSSLAMNDETTIQMVAGAIKMSVNNMMAHPDATLGELSIVSDEERDALIHLGTGKHIDIDPSMTFVKAFEQCASQNPDRLAVADDTNSLTYGELSRRSNVLAHRLIEYGVKPGDFVAVMLDRTIAFPLAVIAIHKAGAAYVPIDMEYPEERQKYMLDDCEAKVVIDDQFMASLPSTMSLGSSKNGQWSMVNGQSPSDLSTPDGLAYMIYTSGSTGKPKGTILHQAGLWNFIQNVIDVQKLTGTDRIAGHLSFSFDAHIEDLFPILTLGGSFHVMPSSIRLDLDAIRRFLFDHQITGGSYTTSIAKLLLDKFDDLPMRFIALGGERLTSVNSDHLTIINCYGSTECTCGTSYYEIAPGKRLDNIPIGRPVANCYYFIVDSCGRLLPRGASGELCIAGIQVGIGYWHQPELTAEKFVDCPFLPLTSHLSPLKMYHTGDLCRWIATPHSATPENDDGQMEYIGRIDNQVKIRGYRIELGEIESCANSFEAIGQAVTAVKKQSGVDAICLYYTAKERDSVVDTNQLQQFLAHTLADYMIPSAYMQLDAMPLTPNGKIDRKKLPEPNTSTHVDYVAPQNLQEKAVARLIGDVLARKKPISMLDNFFILGGDSIKMIQLVSLLHKEGFTAQVSQLMQCNTVRDMARILVSSAGQAISQEPVTGAIIPSAIQHRFLTWHMPQPGRFTQSIVLRASKSIDLSLLRQALQALVSHHDMLRAIVSNNSIVVRSTTDEHLFALRETELASKTDVPHAIAQASIDEGELIDLEHGPLLRGVLLHTEDGDRLLMVCHHIAIDGVSWRILTDDLSIALQQLNDGHAVSLPPKTHSFGYWTEAVSRYRDSYLLSIEKPYWQRVQQQMESMKLTTIPAEKQSTRKLNVFLRGEPVNQLLTISAKAYNTVINDLLITAFCQSYQQATGQDSVSIQIEGHGREPIYESVATERTIGWFTSFYPVIIQGITGDIRHNVRNIKEQLRAVPNNGIGYGVLQYFESKEGDVSLNKDLTPILGFNYLGQIDSQVGNAALATDSSLLLSNGLTAAQLGVPIPSIDVNCAIIDGQFVASFEYDYQRWSDEEAQQLADGFMDSLAQVAQHTAQMAIPEPTASDFGAIGWSEQQFQNIVKHFATRGETLQRVYPLTPMQEGILLTYLSDSGTTVYRLLFRLSLNMLPTEAMLRHTLDYLAEKHEVLRTAILYDGVPHPCQAIVSRQLGLEMLDLTGEQDIDAAAARIHQEQLHRPLSLSDDPLFRLVCMKTGDNSCQLLFFMHHIITDGWSTQVIFSDFLTMLEVSGERSEVRDYTDRSPLTAHPYETFVRQLLRRNRKTGLAYWKTLLADYAARAAIPTFGKPAGIIASPHSQREIALQRHTLFERTPHSQREKVSPYVKCSFDKALTVQLRQLAANSGVTLNTVIELAWGLVLQMYCQTDDVVFARVVSGRGDGANNNLVGPFINSVPVRVHTSAADTTRHALKALQEQTAQSAAYDFCPLSDIQKQTKLGSSLLQSFVAFENYPVDEISLNVNSNWNIKVIQAEEEPFGELALAVVPERGGTLRSTFSYDTSLYGEQQIQQVAETFETIVRNMATMSNRPISELPLITEEAKAELIQLGTGKHLDVAPQMTFTKAFEQCAKQNPNRLAVADDTDSLTYGELSRRSNVLAHRLIESGVKPGDFVAVMLDRTIAFPLAVIAIHKAGAAYVPIDLEYPEERQKYMLGDCETKVIIDDQFVAETDFAVSDSPAGSIDLSTPDGLAYMIYTSGSTGKPKGTILHQAGLWNFIQNVIDIQELTGADRIAGHYSFSFDAHIEGLFPILTLGGSFHVMPSAIRLDLDAIRRFLFDHQITGGGYTTSIAKLLLDKFDDLPLRFIGSAGEKLTSAYSDHMTIINSYGPTECTCGTSYYKIAPGIRLDDIPIGRPVANCYYFIVDSHGRLLPRGVSGELCIAGIQVGNGYWHQPELTAEKFVDCPFLPLTSYLSPLKMYHTGDLCRWIDDGQMEYIGRMDNQVKIRGYRIELDEVESCASRFEGIRQVVAVIKELSGSNTLCLYYTAEGPDKTIDADELRHFMGHSLADYMIPAAYTQLDTMPLTPNGKIDRQRLPAVDESLLHADYVAPESELEKLIVSGFERVLNQEKISVNDDFVRLGGDSLNALKLVFSLGERDITVADVLSLRTPAAIARHAKGINGQSVNLDRYSLESGCPLNNSQMFMYTDIVRFSKYDSYLMPLVVPIDRKYTDEQIRNALDAMFTAHPVLTMHVALRDGVPYLEKGDKPAVMKGSLNPLKTLSMLIKDFDLYSTLARYVIVRIPGRCYLVAIVHHLIFDAVSNNVFCRHFQRALEGEKLDFVDDHFLKVSAFHQEVKGTKQYAEMDKYIRSMLSNLSEANFYRNAEKPGRPGFHKLELGVDRRQVERFTERFATNKNILFTAAMAMTLSKLTGSEKVAFGFNDNGRDRFNNFEDIGLYITGMAMVAHVDDDDMGVFLNRLSDVYYKLSQNSYFPFASLVQEFHISPIIMFQFFPDWITEDGKYNHLPQNETLVNAVLSTQKNFMVEAQVEVVEMGNGYTFRITYSGYYSRKMMKALAKTYKETINQMVSGER